MCEQCEKGRSFTPISMVDDIDLAITGETLTIMVDYMLFGSGESIEVEHDINYCPMCGRKMGGDARWLLKACSSRSCTH